MRALKLISFVLLILSFTLTTLPFLLLSKFKRYRARKYIVQILNFYSYICLKVLSIQVLGNRLSKSKEGRLIVGNHMSYLDAIVLGVTSPGCFVTSIEIKQTPVLGQITESAGCLYVERRSRKGLKNEINDITNALKSGLDVIVFPEGTSTDGEAIKPFKRPLFHAAIESNSQIIPMTINYCSINNDKVHSRNRDYLCWYGEMSFFPHLWNLLDQKNIKIRVEYGEPIFSNQDEDICDLALRIRDVVISSYDPIRK